MLGNQSQNSLSGSCQAGRKGLLFSIEKEYLNDLAFACREDAGFWRSVVSLTHDVLSVPPENISELHVGPSALCSINSAALRVNRRLRGQGLGLSSGGLPSIQRISCAESYL